MSFEKLGREGERPGADPMTFTHFAESRFGAEAVERIRSALFRLKAPAIVVDDLRWCVTGNDAACDLLHCSRVDLPWRRLDEFATEDELPKLKEEWARLVGTGAVEGWYDLRIPNGDRVSVECSATANVLPSRHLVIFIPLDEDCAGKADYAAARALNWSPVTLEPDRRVHLTDREREVMTLVAGGLRSGDIAEQLFLAPETVKSHVSNAMGKLGSHTRAGAVTIALVAGEITWEP